MFGQRGRMVLEAFLTGLIVCLFGVYFFYSKSFEVYITLGVLILLVYQLQRGNNPISDRERDEIYKLLKLLDQSLDNRPFQKFKGLTLEKEPLEAYVDIEGVITKVPASIINIKYLGYLYKCVSLHNEVGITYDFPRWVAWKIINLLKKLIKDPEKSNPKKTN